MNVCFADNAKMAEPATITMATQRMRCSQRAGATACLLGAAMTALTVSGL